MAKDKIAKAFLAITKDKFTIDTIAEMIATKHLADGDIVRLNGYYSAGDGANHIRKISKTDDGSGILLDNGLYANIVHNGEVNVSWFGAKGDGVTDDTLYVDKCFEYAETADGENKTFAYAGQIKYRPTNIKNIKFKQLQNCDIFLDISNIWGGSLRNISLLCENKVKKGLYCDGGQNINVVDEVWVEKAIEYGMYLENSFLGSYSNLAVHKITNGVGIYFGSSHNATVNRVETRWCQTGIKIYSGASLNINTLDTSNSTKEDVYLEYGDVCAINNWYSELSNGHILRMSNRYTAMNLTNVFLDGSAGANFLKIDNEFGGTEEVALRVHVLSGVLTRFNKIFDLTKTLGYAFLNCKIETSNFGDIENITELNISGNIYNNGKSIFTTRRYMQDIGDIFITDTGIQKYYKTFDKVNEVLQFTYYQAEGRVITIDLKSDKGFLKAYVENGVVKQEKTQGLPINVQTNGAFCQIIHHSTEGETTKFAVTVESFATTQNLLTLDMNLYKPLMEKEGVYEDFVNYVDSKLEYDNQRRELEAQRQQAFAESGTDNYEEWLAEQPMMLPVENEPQPSEALLKFKEKYLG